MLYCTMFCRVMLYYPALFHAMLYPVIPVVGYSPYFFSSFFKDLTFPFPLPYFFSSFFKDLTFPFPLSYFFKDLTFPSLFFYFYFYSYTHNTVGKIILMILLHIPIAQEGQKSILFISCHFCSSCKQ